jgi:hypothetical protein
MVNEENPLKNAQNMQITDQVSEFLTVFLISSESRRFIHER